MSNLAGLDRDDLDDLEEWLKERRRLKGERQASADLHAKIDQLADRPLSDADVARIAAAVREGADGGDGAGGRPGAGDGGGSGDGGAGDGDPDPDPKPARTRTRPGRRSGNVYDWDVDEDGKVVRLDTAKVYSGDDEPERVEIPAADDPDDAGGGE
jgi:hypothetical protein